MTLLALGMVILAQPVLELPWACGDTHECTQDHNGGSHVNEGRWAWDFGLPAGTEVWAAAPGTVEMIQMSSNRGGCSSAYANDANYVMVNHGDGTAGLYMHLERGSSGLSVGDPVSTGDPLGRIGLTGWVCGAHLHFQVENLCGSWWCQSVQATFRTYGDPAYPDQLTSENCASCEADVNGGETEISESDGACFKRASKYWWNVSEGHDGHHYYTFTTDADAEEAYGDWTFLVSVAGLYEIQVFIPDTEADSQQAVYFIYHDGSQEKVPLNQADKKGWQSLGVYRFTGAEGEKIHLGDNTGESYEQTKRKLAFDAVRLIGRVEQELTAQEETGQEDGGLAEESNNAAPGGEGCDCGKTGKPQVMLGLFGVGLWWIVRRCQSDRRS